MPKNWKNCCLGSVATFYNILDTQKLVEIFNSSKMTIVAFRVFAMLWKMPKILKIDTSDLRLQFSIFWTHQIGSKSYFHFFRIFKMIIIVCSRVSLET